MKYALKKLAQVPTLSNSKVALVRNWYDGTKEYNIYGGWADVESDLFTTRNYDMHRIDGYCCTTYKRGGKH